jgi:hypothetical protein
MGDNIVTCIGDLAHDLGVPLRHDAGDDHGGFHTLALQRVEHAEDAATMAILGKADGIEVGDARLERIAHGSNSRPVAIRPAFERAAEEDCQSLAAGPTKIGGQGGLGRAGVNAELTHRGNPVLMKRRGQNGNDSIAQTRCVKPARLCDKRQDLSTAPMPETSATIAVCPSVELPMGSW